MKPLSTRVREHLRSNVYGLIAVFIALGGTAVALPGRNTVDSGDIRNAQVKSVDVAQNTLTGGDIKESTLSGFAVAGHNHDGLYALLGHNHDAAYVNEGQADSVTQAMVANTQRANSFQLGAFHTCDEIFGYLDFSSNAPGDENPDFTNVGISGGQILIAWDDLVPDQDTNTEICSQFAVPPDYASGGHFVLRVSKDGETASGVEQIACGTFGGGVQFIPVVGTTVASYTCAPTTTYTPGNDQSFYVVATSGNGGFDDAVLLHSVQWVYNSTG